jgi:hypothetical protein
VIVGDPRRQIADGDADGDGDGDGKEPQVVGVRA